jgi:dissimilatory sulfite reductase (desulfoviridin) alpha/beta subunit
MQKVAEKYGVGHITFGEREGKEVMMEIGNLTEKMMAQRMMMNKNEIQ